MQRTKYFKRGIGKADDDSGNTPQSTIEKKWSMASSGGISNSLALDSMVSPMDLPIATANEPMGCRSLMVSFSSSKKTRSAFPVSYSNHLYLTMSGTSDADDVFRREDFLLPFHSELPGHGLNPDDGSTSGPVSGGMMFFIFLQNPSSKKHYIPCFSISRTHRPPEG